MDSYTSPPSPIVHSTPHDESNYIPMTVDKYTKLLDEKDELLRLLQEDLLEMKLANAMLNEANDRKKEKLRLCRCPKKPNDKGKNINFGEDACITQGEIDEIEKKDKGSPSKFVRLLLKAMIPLATLSKYSVYGQRKHSRLPIDLFLSLEEYVAVRFPTLSHACLIKIVNQVCCDSRRIKKRS
jgi:hypothetical protein